VRDDIQGGVLATLIAAPLVIVCCGGAGRDHRRGRRMDQRRWRPGHSPGGSRCGTDLAQPTARTGGMLRAGHPF